jgi:hypothetical protein
VDILTEDWGEGGLRAMVERELVRKAKDSYSPTESIPEVSKRSNHFITSKPNVYTPPWRTQHIDSPLRLSAFTPTSHSRRNPPNTLPPLNPTLIPDPTHTPPHLPLIHITPPRIPIPYLHLTHAPPTHAPRPMSRLNAAPRLLNILNSPGLRASISQSHHH